MAHKICALTGQGDLRAAPRSPFCAASDHQKPFMLARAARRYRSRPFPPDHDDNVGNTSRLRNGDDRHPNPANSEPICVTKRFLACFLFDDVQPLNNCEDGIVAETTQWFSRDDRGCY